jgi:hypothetical protein
MPETTEQKVARLLGIAADETPNARGPDIARPRPGEMTTQAIGEIKATAALGRQLQVLAEQKRKRNANHRGVCGTR